MLHAALGVGIGAAAASLATRARAHPPQPADLAALVPQLKNVRDILLAKTKPLSDLRLLARSDGYIFTIDVAELMMVLAEVGDETGYAALRDHAAKNLVIDVPSEPFTRGFVAWKWKQGEKPDASGTTEALRLARALWLGGKTFSRPADADLALEILDGYARHETTDQGIWIIRNYFNLATHCFASNSFLVDYDPDFVRQVAGEKQDAKLAKLADDSYGVVKLAVAPSGLLYDIIQPEVATLYPELNMAAFSPNDVIQLSNCCTTAATVTTGLPEIPRKVLAMGINRLDDLRAYYFGRTAEPYNGKAASVTEYSILARIAAGLGARDAAVTIAERAMIDWNWCARHLDSRQVFTLTGILQAMNALLGLA
jgi:hypothetical protein